MLQATSPRAAALRAESADEVEAESSALTKPRGGGARLMRFLRHATRVALEIVEILADLHRDLTRLETRRDSFAEVGDSRIEITNPYRPEHLPDVELQPFYSKLTGSELAAQIEYDCAHLRGEIAKLENEGKAIAKRTTRAA